MERVYNASEVLETIQNYPDYFSFDVEEWFKKPENYCIREGLNLGFAEPKSPGVYWVHFCFHTCRGRDAIRLTVKMLRQLFQDCPIKSAIGLVHEDNKKASWVCRKAGFISLGHVETENGTCEMLHWIKKETL